MEKYIKQISKNNKEIEIINKDIISFELNPKHRFKTKLLSPELANAILKYQEENKANFKGELIGDILFKPNFEDVEYNQRTKEFMELVLTRLKSENIHLLFNGFGGTGKTYSAKMLACELKRPFVYLNGQMNADRIRDILLNLKDNAIVLIDEIHNLPDKVAECIYPAIEYNEISVNGKLTKLTSNPLFIGTTTEIQELPKPLRDRFLLIEFEEPDEDLTKRILRKMGLSEDTITPLVNFTLNIRKLKQFIKYLDVYGERNLNNLTKVFVNQRIDIQTGLSDEQNKYIKYLRKVKKASLRALSLILRRSENYIKLEIEDGLIRKGIINITSKGRELV